MARMLLRFIAADWMMECRIARLPHDGVAKALSNR